MNRLFLWSVIAVPATTLSCKTANNSSVKDVGVVNTQDATTKVIYADQNKVYLKVCKPPLAPPLTRNCPSDATPKYLDLATYLYKLPYDVGPYQRDDQGLSLVTKALQDANNAVAGGNQNAVPTVEKLTPIKLNLEKILKISKDLSAAQQDLTYYEYQDEFQKLLSPFGETGGSGGSPAAGMRFITAQGRSFAMQETETTRGQWKAVMGKYPEELPGWNDCYSKEKTVFEDFHPASCVSWNDANDFARKMNDKHDGYNYRLPTEEEWGYAAGNIEGSTFGWCDTTSTQPVGKLKANNGLYDMVGNVWEWTSTPWDSSGSLRVIRGGSWWNGARGCRSAYRGSLGPGIRYDNVGFRLVRTSSP